MEDAKKETPSIKVRRIPWRTFLWSDSFSINFTISPRRSGPEKDKHKDINFSKP
jgi:hypothetical protein